MVVVVVAVAVAVAVTVAAAAAAIIPEKYIELPVKLFIISVLVIVNCSAIPINSNFSMNSGIIDIPAEVIVKRVNSILCPFSNVSNTKKVLTAKDFPLPLPPVTTKYLFFELNRA